MHDPYLGGPFMIMVQKVQSLFLKEFQKTTLGFLSVYIIIILVDCYVSIDKMKSSQINKILYKCFFELFKLIIKNV